MLTLLTPLHAIAVRRGDGLRPELAGLLTGGANAFCTASGESKMSREQDNKAVVGRWFDGFWGSPWNPQIIDELGAPDMLLQYSLHAPRRGREDVRNFMMDFRAAFPDLKFWGAADLIAEGDCVVGRWEGGGTHTGPAFSDFLAGSLPPEDALHGYDGTPCRERQDRRGNRARRRGHRAHAAWYLESRLTLAGTGSGHVPDPVSTSAEPETLGAFHSHNGGAPGDERGG